MSTRKTTTKVEKIINAHPIQLVGVDVIKLSFMANEILTPKVTIDGKSILLGVGGLQEDGDKSFWIFVRAAYGIPDIDLPKDAEFITPCSILVELAGRFKTNMDLSPEVIHSFKDNGALSVLLPYLREHVYSLSVRSGIQPIIIPVKQVPLIKITSEGKLTP